jgi:hypothetical protein
MPTINFHLGSATTNWDGGNDRPAPPATPDQRAGLENQAAGNIDGAQEGERPPAGSPIVAEIVNFEASLSTAQIYSFAAGFLHADGARGGPEALSLMTKTSGRFDLFDAWANSPIPSRRKIWRGQELFNNRNGDPMTGPRCRGCHNSANNGTNVSNALFDIGTASAEARTPDLPLYTIQNRTTGEIRQLTDTGRGRITGAWNDLALFKTPTLRALAQRAPYFHNGIAATLEDVVRHYEEFLGFDFTDEEEEDLVAFLKAL